MFKLKYILFFLFSFFVASLVMAQAVTPDVPAVSNTDFLQALIQSLGGIKGAGALAIAGVVVQLLIKFLGTPLAGSVLANVSGAWKLTAVVTLSLVSGVLALMLPPTSLGLGAALVHSSTLTAFMVFGNQVYKQFLEKPKA